jgi:hypothetical protein
MFKLLSGYLGDLPFMQAASVEERGGQSQASGPRVAPASLPIVSGADNGESLVRLSLSNRRWDWQREVVAHMTEGRPLVLEGFPLEDVARLCLAHHFRWSVYAGPAANGHTQLLLKPGEAPAPVSSRPTGKGSSGD